MVLFWLTTCDPLCLSKLLLNDLWKVKCVGGVIKTLWSFYSRCCCLPLQLCHNFSLSLSCSTTKKKTTYLKKSQGPFVQYFWPWCPKQCLRLISVSQMGCNAVCKWTSLKTTVEKAYQENPLIEWQYFTFRINKTAFAN